VYELEIHSVFLELGMKDEAIGIADWLIDVMWNDEKGRLTRYTTSTPAPVSV